MKRCPFCGNAGLTVQKSEHAELYTVVCGSCAAQGPIKRTELSAVKHWNKRVPVREKQP